MEEIILLVLLISIVNSALLVKVIFDFRNTRRSMRVQNQLNQNYYMLQLMSSLENKDDLIHTYSEVNKWKQELIKYKGDVMILFIDSNAEGLQELFSQNVLENNIEVNSEILKNSPDWLSFIYESCANEYSKIFISEQSNFNELSDDKLKTLVSDLNNQLDHSINFLSMQEELLKSLLMNSNTQIPE